MISIVVAIYNEDEIIPRLHGEVLAAMREIGEDWEVVYVDDGSRDSSLPQLLALQSSDPRIRVVELSRNWGHQAALSAGLAAARGDAIVLMDGDLQDPPSLIPSMVERWRAGAQVVIATRRSRAERGFRGGLFPLFYKVLGAVSDFDIPLNAGIFGLLDRKAADAINRLPEANRYLPGLRAWVGFRTEHVLYDRADRAAGEPKATYRRLITYGLNAILSFSYKPLRAMLAAGALLTMTGVLLFLLGGVELVQTGGVPTRSSAFVLIIAAIFFAGGLVLSGLGVVSEYIARIYDEVRRRPLYLINRIHASQSEAVSETRTTHAA